MNFRDHSSLAGEHSFLSASYPHWVNYDLQKLEARWHSKRAAALGTDLHLFAQHAIRLGIKQSKTKKTLNMYINDGISYKMTCEQPLFYSENAFGTPDTISFRRNFLRIHDLKTGLHKAGFKQLEIYAAYFCLEYGVSPFDIQIELRIYQNNEVRVHKPEPDVIMDIMEKIVYFDNHIEQLKQEG